MNINPANPYVVQQTDANEWVVGRMTQFGFHPEGQTYFTESAAQRRCDFLNAAFRNSH